MDEAISRQELIKKLDEALGRITKNVSKESDAYHIVYGTVDIIKCMIMTIQPEIVRCKDCRYYNSEEKECLDLLGHGRRWEEDDFCSYAERREVTT